MSEPRRPAPRVGTVLTLPGASIAELLAEPFDLVWVDLEHGALGRAEAQDLILGAQAAGVEALVRLPLSPHQTIGAMLDAGADGVVLADVRDPAAAAAAISHAVHPPVGERGWGPRRLLSRGRRAPEELEPPLVTVQIESVEGVENAAAIAAVPGLSAIVVGTADLSFSLGAPLKADSPDLLAAIDRVRAAAAGAGIEFGLAGALDRLPASALRGAGSLVHATDARLCAGAADAAAGRLRAAANEDNAGRADLTDPDPVGGG